MNPKPKILIIDDKSDDLQELEIILKNLEVDLVIAVNGKEAIKCAADHDFAIAFLDVQMPEMAAFDLAVQLRAVEKFGHVPIIFISAIPGNHFNVFNGIEKSFFSFVIKPFHHETLLGKVSFFIDKYQQELAFKKLNKVLEKKNIDIEVANKELESFTYSVSHDLRAPLRAISGYAEIFLEDYAGTLDPEGLRLIGNISENVKKMGNLIDSLLTFSRIGKQAIKKKTIDMNKLVKEVLDENINSNLVKRITLKVSSLPPAYGDHELLKQVLVNLVSNAFKYSSKMEEPLLEIGAQNNGDGIIYFIRDNGVGFEMQYAGKLFGVFQRLHSADEFDGTGVGLAIVKRIIIRHEGRIWAEGKKDGGATFCFSLPAISDIEAKGTPLIFFILSIYSILYLS